MKTLFEEIATYFHYLHVILIIIHIAYLDNLYAAFDNLYRKPALFTV